MTLDEAIQKHKDLLKEFIKDYEEELNDKNFKSIYEAMSNYSALKPSFTALLLKNGMNPLYYMSYVPGYFATKLNIKEIMIPNNVLGIGINAFSRCENLTKITIPDNVTNIWLGAFEDCSSLTSIIIPNSIKTIHTNAFNGCGNLKDVYYEGSEEDWKNMKIGSGNKELFNANIHYNS